MGLLAFGGPGARIEYDVATLFDNLIGAHEHRSRHGVAQGPGSLEVDDQLEGRRLLNRQIGRLGAFEDLSCVNAEPSEMRWLGLLHN